ncbi:polysaccharide biosynthesis tyrosine autokinase [soil metagenome]
MRGYLRAVRRNVLLIGVCVLVLLSAAFAYTQIVEPVYASTTRVIVSSTTGSPEPGGGSTGAVLATGQATNYVSVVESQLVASRVQSRVAVDPDLPGDRLGVDVLLDHVSATSVEGSSVVEIRYTDRDPSVAQQVAQAYAEELVAAVGEIEQAEAGGPASTKLTVLDFASYEPNAVTPQPVRDLGLALAAGLLLGLLLTALRQLFGTTINSPDDLAAVTRLPVLATVSHASGADRSRLITELDQRAPRVEAFRVLRTNVQFLDIDSPQKVIVVTSSVPEEGKTSTTVNLALTLMRAGVSTLLVDGDLRRPGVARTFGIAGTAGVTTVLLGKVELEDAIWRHPESGLDVLPSGVVPPNAAELVQTQAMASLIDRVRGQYDVVLVDAPPLLPVTDAALLAARADAVILVVRHGRATRDQVKLSLDRLAQVDVEPVGVVLNDVPTARRGGYGAYGPYGSYAKSPKSQKSPRASRSSKRSKSQR